VEGVHSCDKLANTASSLDALLGNLGELLGADNAGAVDEATLTEDLEEALTTIDY